MTDTPKRPLDEEGVEPLPDRVRELPRAADRRTGRQTSVWAAVAAAALAFMLFSGAFATEPFRRLNGAEIAARFAGMELTDEVHWAQVFGKGGRLSSFSMGKATDGTWRVQNQELCWNENKRSRCYEVWMSGNKVQLRQPGIDIYDEGVLRRPQAHHQP